MVKTQKSCFPEGLSLQNHQKYDQQRRLSELSEKSIISIAKKRGLCSNIATDASWHAGNQMA